MDLGVAQLGLGMLAGLLSTLSPCVLPLLPLVASSAITAHRGGLIALAAGLALSYATIGVFVAAFGWSIGLDLDAFRFASALVLVGLAAVLLIAPLQRRFAFASARFSHLGHGAIARLSYSGWLSQLGVGVILGAVWSPCVGPTLGAASLLAAQGKNLVVVGAIMLAFGVGAAIPLLLVGTLSRQALKRWRSHLMGAGRAGRYAMGCGALLVAMLIVTGLDRSVEAAMVNASPDWLTDLTTRF